MRWLIVLASVVCIVWCHTTETPESKGVIDWINGWFSSTSPPPIPTNEPPEDCPECHCGIARTRRRIVGGYETVKLEMLWMAVLMYGGRFYCGGSLINDLYVLTAAHCTAGVSTGIARTRRRIVGGYETVKLEMLWMAVLMYGGRYYCGGSLINDLYVLTAAHCTAGFRKERITVRFLEHDRSMPNETRTIDRNVSAIIRHLRYNPGTYDNDIALLRLERRMDLSTAIKRARDDEDLDLDNIKPSPVCLPTRGLSFSNHSAVVSGWGTTEEGGGVSSTLQEVYVPIMSNSDCKQTSYKQRITDNMLCAGYPDGGKDACQGDSGGPLHVLNTTTNKYQEVGVVSWGEGCARPDKPGVYTRVNRYLTWIKSNTKDACYCK